MELNKIYHGDFTTNTLPDKCANLIIADPPYFEVKGAFDFVWENMKAYLLDVEKWAKECKRLLADNGTLFWYGHAKNIAYSQVILDEYFSLLNNMVWRKKDSIQYQYYSPELARTFNTHNERILMYEHQTEFHFNPFMEVIHKQMAAKGLRELDFRKLRPSKNGNLTGWCSNILNGDNIPTREDWVLIEGLIESGYTYAYLHKKYVDYRRHFDNSLKLEEVLEFSQEAHITKEYDHPTKKPETLTRALIQVCSRPNDLVVVPFAGSGTECAMAAKEGRRFIGWDVEQKYVEMSNNRVAAILRQPTLFQEAWVANTNTRDVA